MATGSRFLLRLDLVTVQPAVGLALAMADSLAAFLRRVREMDFHRAVAAVSFAVRFSPETDLFAVVLFGLSRSPICFATADFVPAADPSDPAGFGFVVVVAAFAADLASSACSVAVALGKGRAVAVPFCFLTHQSSF